MEKMSDNLREICLPSELFTDEDILMDKENFYKKGINSSANPFGSFGSYPCLVSPVELVTESNCRDDLLTGLTRQFAHSTLHKTQKTTSAKPRNHEKMWVPSGSPQSTLSPVFSNGYRNAEACDPIYASSGQGNMFNNNGGPMKNGVLHAPTRNFAQIHPSKPINGLHTTHSGSVWSRRQTNESRGSRGCVGNGGGFVGTGAEFGVVPESAWPPLHVHKRPSGGGVGGGVVVPGGGCGGGGRRDCVGTGVFLPRRYTAASGSHKKTAGQALNKSTTQSQGQTQGPPQPHFNGGGHIRDYDVLISRRNALLVEQTPNTVPKTTEVSMNQEISLPQEWTY